MIRPGLLTASVSSADHFGMSAGCLVCLSMCRCSFFGLVLLKGCFPLVATEGTRLSAHPHTVGRNAVEHSERIEELCGWAVVYDWSAEGGSENKRRLGSNAPQLPEKEFKEAGEITSQNQESLLQ